MPSKPLKDAPDCQMRFAENVGFKILQKTEKVEFVYLLNIQFCQLPHLPARR